jgi:uncharacterized protein (DUF1697 family)
MPRYCAFLRGINLGRRRLSMDRLREHFEALGLANVATFIASGNVIFDANDDDPTALEVRIEAHLAGALGYEVDTFLRTLTELDAVARSEAVAVGASGGWMPHVIFLRNPPGEEVARRLRDFETDGDRFLVQGREVYWLRRGPLSDSIVTAADLTKAMGGATNTMRNLNTVRRIVAKYAPGA